MDSFDEHGILGNVSGSGYIVCRVEVVCSKIDDHNVSSWMFREIPQFWVISPDINGSRTGIRGVEPLVEHSSQISVALLVEETNSWICGDGIFGVPKSGT